MTSTQQKSETDKKKKRSQNSHNQQEQEDTRHAVTVAVPSQTAFSFFRDFSHLSSFMKDLKSVEVLSPTRSRWTVEVKGKEAQWEVEITKEEPNRMISWRSVEGSEVDTAGTIWFTPAPEALGTIIHLSLEYKIPGGKLAELMTRFTGEDPRSLSFINLRRLKCFLETGEIATIEGQTSGREPGAEIIVKH